jgi:hypothetical protein
VGSCAQLLISRFGSRFTKKKPGFDTPKMEKALFVGHLSNSDLQICKYGLLDIKWKKGNKIKFIFTVI